MLRTASLLLCAAGLVAAAPAATTPPAARTFRQYCFGCHNQASAMGGVNLEKLTAAQLAMGDHFQTWEKVAAVLEQKRMPPAKLPQPPDAARSAAATWIRASLRDQAQRRAGDPGRVTVRRLTSAEYAYTIQDLTGVPFNADRDFASDSVGGEGFTNFGDVQFMQDAGLERYLEAAKRVANHAVVGAGPLSFYADPGQSGFELSAIHRIQAIYNAYGFRAASGEGGKPYGLDRYAKACLAAWQFKHRAALGEPNATLDHFAARQGMTARFVQHIWSVLQQPAAGFPTSEVIARFRALPPPSAGLDAARKGCDEIQSFLINWPRFLLGAGALAAGGQGDERALILTDESVQAAAKHRFRFFSIARGRKAIRLYASVASANPGSQDKPVVLWSNALVRFRKTDRSLHSEKPLADFVTATGAKESFEIAMPPDAFGFEFQADAVLGAGQTGDAIVRATVNDREEIAQGRPTSALLGTPDSAGYKAWKANVLDFAAALPQTSHGEPTPSDKDPIPPPFNTDYNQPERDLFHVKLKYYRDDKFLVDKMLDDATRVKLDQAWSDVRASFDYHNAFENFVNTKFAGKPAAAEPFLKSIHADFSQVKREQESAHPGHLDDALDFASRAWRRPLTAVEKDRLRAFYTKTRETTKLDHTAAIRSLIARILVAPAFLYRLEQPATTAAAKALTNWELASRLSYFLWSSSPDAELRRAAAAGELAQPAQLAAQVKRMLADAKARRFSTEFFGQWLGFYRFDQYTGVDSTRFPEFTDEIKGDMYDEAVTFFEHIVRQDRPVRELLFADYTFLTKPLAQHYGIKQDVKSSDVPQLVTGSGAFHRGGLLRLGAVLTTTSAPLRTSPVKRGDWILRRVLGTPTPPPPADAGSIPADDKAFAGQTVRERLEAHKRNATCAACHSRIDPLGFPLERYDPVGRWRETYPDGKPIHDAAALADGTPIAGVDGLMEYLRANESQVIKVLSHKLLGYALGRTVLVSDQPLVDKLTQAGGEANFSRLIAEIVASPQFRRRRDAVTNPPPAAPVKQIAQATGISR